MVLNTDSDTAVPSSQSMITQPHVFHSFHSAPCLQSVILAGVFWFQALPAAAELCNLTALHSALLTLQVRSREHSESQDVSA
jgi:hypothetical protein